MDTAVLISCMALTGTLLIVLLLLCRLVQPHDIAWFLSNREDKLKLSKMRLYNANGYLMHSGSEILLGSTGSFQRFDSVDRDYKPQYGARPGVPVPPWRTSIEEPDIPPQPLRPAPSPKEAALMREKSIHRQTSEPKVPPSRSIVITPIPRPVPRKQHSAPISFPLPVLGSPQDKRPHQAGQSQEPPPRAVPQYQAPCTNPFFGGLPLTEDAVSDRDEHWTAPPVRPPPPPLTVQPSTAASRLPSAEFRELKSANNPFIDSPAAVSKRYNQQQQQQSCVFNFDPAMVQSLFNRPVPGGSLLFGNTGKPSTTTTTNPSPATDAGGVAAPTAPPTQPAPSLEDDPLRRVNKRLSKMENLRKMSRLIESNQLLLNIYQQFNRTIVEQSEPSPTVDASLTSEPLLPSTSPAQTQLAVGTSNEPANSGDEGPTQAQALPPYLGAPGSTGPPSSADRYHDSPRSDITESIRAPTVSRSIKHLLRNRSFSESEFSERKLIKTFAILSESEAASQAGSSSSASPPSLVKNASYKDFTRYQRGSVGSVGLYGSAFPFDGSDTLQKTVSESFLEQYSLARYNEPAGGPGDGPRGDAWFGAGAECYRPGGVGSVLPSSSCESVASQSSVVFSDLVQSPGHPVAGYLCVGLQFGQATDSGKELLVTVQEAKDLVAPPGVASLETFVKVFLAPDEANAWQTKVCQHTERHASFQETFNFWVDNHTPVRRSLWFHVYHSNADLQTLIGEVELEMDENIQRPITTWLKLIDSSYRKASVGELMLSLSYLPTAERLTVVVVKARNLALKNRGGASVRRWNATDEPDPTAKDGAHESDGGGNVFVKVYLLQNDRKIAKKKTSVKRAERFPIYNEAIIFSLPPYMLSAVQIRLSVVQMVQRAEPCAANALGPLTPLEPSSGDGGFGRKASVKLISLGHVIVGSGTTGKGLRHWHQMLTALRKPVAMWHGLRGSTSERRRKHEPTGDAAIVGVADDPAD